MEDVYKIERKAILSAASELLKNVKNNAGRVNISAKNVVSENCFDLIILFSKSDSLLMRNNLLIKSNKKIKKITEIIPINGAVISNICEDAYFFK